MCTCVSLKDNGFYFGRTLDYDISYGEEAVITPRNFPFSFSNGERLNNHFAFIGTAFVPDRYPLYYDGVNEKGLCMAGLNFVGNAFYRPKEEGKINLAVYEFIPYILSTCATAEQAVEKIKLINLTCDRYGDLPPAQLHWTVADKDGSFVVEFLKSGLKIYPDPVGVMTNNPPFDFQILNLQNYLSLSPCDPENTFSKKLDLKPFSRGTGGIGLPGDFSSVSRFVRAAFLKSNYISDGSKEDCLSGFFHILDAVSHPKGAVAVGDGYDITVYSCCFDAGRGIYYYITYANRAITAVDMFAENLDGNELSRYPHVRRQNITFQNGR